MCEPQSATRARMPVCSAPTMHWGHRSTIALCKPDSPASRGRKSRRCGCRLTGEPVTTLGGALVKNAGVRLCLATIAEIIAPATFVSRQDVDTTKATLLPPFQDAEEIAADEMDQATFQSLISLHGALTNHLVQTALPLPRMLQYQFYKVLPSLVMAYKLYDDASRCDELRAENKIVHPAFCPLQGEALSQ